MKSVVTLTLAGTLAAQLVTFYWLSIFAIPQILVALQLARRGKPAIITPVTSKAEGPQVNRIRNLSARRA